MNLAVGPPASGVWLPAGTPQHLAPDASAKIAAWHTTPLPEYAIGVTAACIPETGLTCILIRRYADAGLMFGATDDAGRLHQRIRVHALGGSQLGSAAALLQDGDAVLAVNGREVGDLSSSVAGQSFFSLWIRRRSDIESVGRPLAALGRGVPIEFESPQLMTARVDAYFGIRRVRPWGSDLGFVLHCSSYIHMAGQLSAGNTQHVSLSIEPGARANMLTAAMPYPMGPALERDQGAHNMCFVDDETQHQLDNHLSSTTNRGMVYAIGGQYDAAGRSFKDGLHLYSLIYSRGQLVGEALRFTRQRLLITGEHPGCLELRSKFNGIGEFDGQSQLIYFDGRWLVYSRANCGERGHRQVQVCVSSTPDNFHDCQWVSFADIPLDADIYFAHVYRTNANTLVAVIPLAHSATEGAPTEGGVYVAESYDGIDFGPPLCLLQSDIYMRRTADMPVLFAGAPLDRHAEFILPMQENVRARMAPDSPGREVLRWWCFSWPTSLRPPSPVEADRAKDTRTLLRLKADKARVGSQAEDISLRCDPPSATAGALDIATSEGSSWLSGAIDMPAECETVVVDAVAPEIPEGSHQSWLSTLRECWERRGRSNCEKVGYAELEEWLGDNGDFLQDTRLELNLETVAAYKLFESGAARLPVTAGSKSLGERLDDAENLLTRLA